MRNKLIIPKGYPYEGCELDELITKKDIEHRISTISRKISREYRGRIPVIIGVLNGAFMFLSDLVKISSELRFSKCLRIISSLTFFNKKKKKSFIYFLFFSFVKSNNL